MRDQPSRPAQLNLRKATRYEGENPGRLHDDIIEVTLGLFPRHTSQAWREIG